jgi:hypothetical protein
VAILAVPAMPAFAHSELYVANLTGAAEIPTNASPGTGTAFVTVDFDLVTNSQTDMPHHATCPARAQWQRRGRTEQSSIPWWNA